DVVGGFRNFVLVYKQRQAPVVNAALPSQSFDSVYEVVHPMEGAPAANASLRMAYSGGVIRLRTTLALNSSNSASSQREDIRRGDWIALTNVTFDFHTNRFVQQIDFYMVLDYTVDASNFGVVTIQGPDFDMQLARFANGLINDTIDPAIFGDFAPNVAPGPPAFVVPSKTYAIHLPDVWAVIERSYQ
ncbi:MAG TPA: hypothetical protein PKD54_10440, partial [Pirellulaceae bacterium]|nr:hypothetical protein [Pirellulaceae bacterium]